MSDAMRLAELDGQNVELLPARTLLSLHSVVDLGIDGVPGTPGTPGPGTPGPDMLPLSLPTAMSDTGSAGSSSPG